MEGKNLFSKFDIRWGYNNIPIEPADRWKATFKTPLGTYQLKVLTFGMKNAPAQFTRLINRVFKMWKDKWFDNREEETVADNYMDDFAIGSKDTPKGRAGHIKCLHELFEVMEKNSFYLRLSKCCWMQSQLELLGVILENGIMRIDPAKQEGISKWPRILKDKTDIQ